MSFRLKYEQETLLDRVSYLLKTFDAELHVLRHEKFKLDVTMKNADLRQVTLFEELALLKEFEKRENILGEKVEGKQQEKMDMQAKVGNAFCVENFEMHARESRVSFLATGKN